MKPNRFIILIILLLPLELIAQVQLIEKDYALLENRLLDEYGYIETEISDTLDENSKFPSPKSVLFKSMMIPGWGQIENGQYWKVPIIYGMFVGVGFYANYLNNQYQDYRAAYYNQTQDGESDFKFGQTPERLEGINVNQLQSVRDNFHNQRDFSFVIMGLAYGLNIVDAYVYAHMRSFDVSDDLSARTSVAPAILTEGSPGIRVSLTLYSK